MKKLLSGEMNVKFKRREVTIILFGLHNLINWWNKSFASTIEKETRIKEISFLIEKVEGARIEILPPCSPWCCEHQEER